MATITYTTMRAHLAKTMQRVCEDHVPITISDFEALKETNYLLKSSVNAARLAEAIDEIETMIANDKAK